MPYKKKDSEWYYTDCQIWVAEEKKFARKYRPTYTRDKASANRVQAIYDEIGMCAAQEGKAQMAEWARRLSLAAGFPKHSDLAEGDALAVVEKLWQVNGGEGKSKINFVDVAEDMLRRKENKISAAHIADSRRNLARIVEFFGEKVRRDLAVWKVADWQALYDAGMQKHSARTAKKPVAFAGTVFSHAVRMGHTQFNPCQGVMFESSKPNFQVEPFTSADVAKLQKYFISLDDEQWLTLFYLGLCTGARLGDCVAMKKENIMILENGVVLLKFIQSKTRAKVGKEVLFAAAEPLRSHLQKIIPRLSDGDFLTPKFVGKSNGGRIGISKQFIMHQRNAGVEFSRVAMPAGKNFASKSFSSFRKTIATAMANAGVPVDIATQITGHATRQVHLDHYVRYQAETLGGAAEKAMQWLGV